MLKYVLGMMACVAGLAATSEGALARDLYRWVQYVPHGLEARVVTDDPTCPRATIDGQNVPMRERSGPGENYPVRACTLSLPKGIKSVTIQDVPLPLPKERPERILIIGDTGCRLKGTDRAQSCNDMSEWPFRLGATMSADFKPDLVIHVGDMHYRESPCPAGNLGCAGSPFGDTWNVWKEDFFDPAEALLNTAPWVMVRGNHEECSRGGIGWARTLDPYTYDAKSGRDGCLGPQQPYNVDLGGLTMMVMDVSTADEWKLNEQQAAFFRPQFEATKNIAGPVWLAFHRPIWAVEFFLNGKPAGDNKTLAAAAKGALAPNVQAILSGHHHVFEVVKYENDLPLQIISGHGGNELLLDVPPPVGQEVNGEKIVAGIARPGIFGFAMIERERADRSGTTWTLTGYDRRGQSIGMCKLDGRNLACP
jgi:Calcineurin-like phosphoesterase